MQASGHIHGVSRTCELGARKDRARTGSEHVMCICEEMISWLKQGVLVTVEDLFWVWIMSFLPREAPCVERWALIFPEHLSS